MAQLLHRRAHVREHRLADQHLGVVAVRTREQVLHRRPHAVDDRAQVLRLGGRLAGQLLERRDDRAALRVAEHHDEPRAEPRGRELDAADLRRRDDVARDADHEQVAEALIEYELRGHARVRAAQDDRERLLTRDELRAALLIRRSGRRPIRDEPAIAVAQPRERFCGGDHRGRTLAHLGRAFALADLMVFARLRLAARNLRLAGSA